MLDHYNLRCMNLVGKTYVQVRREHPAFAELREAGFPVDTYRVQTGTGERFGRPEVRLVPIEDWDGCAAMQRGSDTKPVFRPPTIEDLAEDVAIGVMEPLDPLLGNEEEK